MKNLIPIFLFLVPLICFSQKDNVTGHQLAGNLYAYPYLEKDPPLQTAVPEGYEPFHLEHYGRHGSRWLLGSEDYSVPVRNLERAEKAGKLTPLGVETLEALRFIETQSHGRLGELSDKGALQHQAIGRRMARNYPQIFNREAELTAKSTPVVRCIISMANALEGIQSEVPGIHIDKDASEADMWFMNFDDKSGWKVKDSVSAIVLPPYRHKVLKTNDFLTRLVTDSEFARDSVAPGLMPRIYWVLGNTQSHIGQPWLLEEVFSREELIENWKSGNAGWFIHGGNSALTNGRMPYVQRYLLTRIIERTDSAIVTGTPGANLRYGHDGILVSLITLMEAGGYGESIDSLEELEDSNWRDYALIPMAGNLQLVFYRPVGKGSFKDEDILVKALINEEEVTLPGQPVDGPYYRWKDLRDYYLSKLKNQDFNKIAGAGS